MVENLESMEKEWKDFLDKEIKLVYDDGGQYPSKKQGVLSAVTDTHFIIKNSGKSEAILKSKVLRLELASGGWR